MKVRIDQEEIEAAVLNFLKSQGISMDGMEVQVTLIAGRSPAGHYAEIEISRPQTKTEIGMDDSPDKPARKRRVRSAVEEPGVPVAVTDPASVLPLDSAVDSAKEDPAISFNFMN